MLDQQSITDSSVGDSALSSLWCYGLPQISSSVRTVTSDIDKDHQPPTSVYSSQHVAIAACSLSLPRLVCERLMRRFVLLCYAVLALTVEVLF